MILSCNNISKSFGTDIIIKSCSFNIEDHEKAAIVGINGAGKSTLLKIITGEEPADTGIVTLAKDKTLGYLAQQQDLQSDRSIYDELLSVKQYILDMESELRRIEAAMNSASGDELEALMNRYTNLNHEFEMNNGYAYKSEITGVLKGLGFAEEDFSLHVNTLSGGQKTRVSLGKLLLSKPDIIMLDEPTNHLDMESISWLENYLLNYNGAVLIVAHDRYFLDKIVSKIIEIDNGDCTVFSGNYTDYASKKAILRNMKLKEYLNQQRDIKHQEEVIAKLKQFNREKSIKRAESREKMLDKMTLVDKPMEINTDIHLKLEPSRVSGNDVLSVKGLSKAFPPQTLFTDISFEIKRGEHIAIIGDNGTGKTTLLKSILGLTPALSGSVELGDYLSIGYFEQEMDQSVTTTCIEEIWKDFPSLSQYEVRSALAKCGLTTKHIESKVKVLSGGEQAKVRLCKLINKPTNILLLDEPTNHLDVDAKSELKRALMEYKGSILMVCHEPDFYDGLATDVWDCSQWSLKI